MNKILFDFLKSNDMTLELPADKNKRIISQWTNARNPFTIILYYGTSKIIRYVPFQRMICFMYKYIFGIKIGKRVSFAPMQVDVVFPEAIEIGDGSALGWESKLITHEYTQNKVRYSKIKIGRNVVIGGFSTIRGGITIGDNSIIAMNSFLNKDVPAGEIWGGVPAKKIDIVKHK